MKKFFLGLIALGLVAGAVTFYSCQKDGELKITNSQVVKPVGYLEFHGFDLMGPNGVSYYWIGWNTGLTAEKVFAHVERYGGELFFYDWKSGKISKWHVGPVYYPPIPPPTTMTPPPPYILQTLMDITNASVNMRHDIVVENSYLPYDENVSLSAVIDEALLAKVISGKYVISSATEAITFSEDGTSIHFDYNIVFTDVIDNDVIVDKTISFTWEGVEPDEVE